MSGEAWDEEPGSDPFRMPVRNPPMRDHTGTATVGVALTGAGSVMTKPRGESQV